jgi:hypothetical protein
VLPVGVGELDVDVGAAKDVGGGADLAGEALHAVLGVAHLGDPVGAVGVPGGVGGDLDQDPGLFFRGAVAPGD